MPVSLCPGGEGGEEGEVGVGWQGPPSGPVKPPLHLHALLPSSESMLAAQAEHDDEPAGEKVLRAHLTHEAVGEVVEPSGQKLHSDTDVAPTTGRNLPAEQAAHDCVVFDAGHCEQTDAPDCDEE